MFKKNANTMFNNTLFNCPIMAATPENQQFTSEKAMHEQMARLYEAAEKMMGVTGQSAVARLLNASPQTLKNWEARGMSSDGMLDAQQVIGCSAVWIRSGAGPMVVGEPFTVQQAKAVGGGLADALKLTCETAEELQMLSVFRLANKDERAFIAGAIDDIRNRIRVDILRDDLK